jgi:hypothetical protein
MAQPTYFGAKALLASGGSASAVGTSLRSFASSVRGGSRSPAPGAPKAEDWDHWTYTQQVLGKVTLIQLKCGYDQVPAALFDRQTLARFEGAALLVSYYAP